MAISFRKAQWIQLGITSAAGLLVIAFYLIVIPQTLVILNTEVVNITNPSEGDTFVIGDKIEVSVVFDPSVVGGEAKGYYLLASSPEKVYHQTEVSGISNTGPFTLTRSFVATNSTDNLVIRVELTIGSEVYYNEILVSIIDPTVEITTEEPTTTIETAPGYEMQTILGGLAGIICALYWKSREEST